MDTPRLLLASASPRRTALLAQLGVAHRVHAAEIDETPRPGESPELLVDRLAREKAMAARGFADGLPCLGADTEVVLDSRVFGKPRDAADAQAMLLALSGRTHQVLSAVALLRVDGSMGSRLSVSQVQMRRISGAEARWYCQTGEPLGKAGGYAIQGLAAVFIESLSGSFTGVMGLPLFETAQLLTDAGLFPASGSGA